MDSGCYVVSVSRQTLVSLHPADRRNSSVGSETTAGQLEWWLLAMVAFPEAQKRAQAELDAVIGHARAPRVADREQMPYVDALSREVTRWRVGIPTGVPHLTETDDWYEGMFIPKGSTIISNIR